MKYKVMYTAGAKRDLRNIFRYIKELKDPNETHKYSLKTCLEEVNKRLSRNGIVVYFNGNQVKINNYHFRLMNDYFKIKENEKFCYVYQVSTQPQYSYSQQAIDFIYDELRKAPNTLLDDLKERCAKKIVNPRSKGILSA